MFEEKFTSFVEEQKLNASSRRLEMLQRELTGTRKMFQEVLWPVFKTFDGFTLEHTFKNVSGITLFVDAFYEPLKIAFESEGYAAHAENITRDRFSFERSRIRTLAKFGYVYVPFSWDEMDKKAEACRSSVYELLGIYGGREHIELSLYERETIRYATLLQRPFRIDDVRICLQKGTSFSRGVIKQLLAKKLIAPHHQLKQRHHEFVIVRDCI